MNSYLTKALREGPQTVKQLAAVVGISESRVRELLKVYIFLHSDGCKPAAFWLDPELTIEAPTPAETPR